jgi:hypothetical protein
MEVVIMKDIRENCIQELANKHGRHISLRFERMLENRENATGKQLTGEEVQDLKVRFDGEIYRELLMKGGK